MCCGRKVVDTRNAARAAAAAAGWQVLNSGGEVVSTKTSEIAAKLAAARIGGTVRRSPAS